MLPLALSLLPAAYQIGQGIYQKSQAKKLKESTYVPPELLMNRDLAQQQAYSRRSPGAAQAESNIRRNLATTISAGQRSFGGDANKVAAITAGATAQANDANAQIASQGQQFSENAFGRMGQANNAIAGQKRQNRNEFNAAKAELIASGNQNMFNGISNAATAGLTSYLAGDFGGKKKGGATAIPAGTPTDLDIDPSQPWLGTKRGTSAGGSTPGGGQNSAWNDYLLNQSGFMNMNQDPSGVWRMPGMGNPTTNRMQYSRFGRGYRR